MYLYRARERPGRRVGLGPIASCSGHALFVVHVDVHVVLFVAVVLFACARRGDGPRVRTVDMDGAVCPQSARAARARGERYFSKAVRLYVSLVCDCIKGTP